MTMMMRGMGRACNVRSSKAGHHVGGGKAVMSYGCFARYLSFCNIYKYASIDYISCLSCVPACFMTQVCASHC